MLCGLDASVLVHAHLPVLTGSETVRANLLSKLGDDCCLPILLALRTRGPSVCGPRQREDRFRRRMLAGSSAYSGASTVQSWLTFRP